MNLIHSTKEKETILTDRWNYIDLIEVVGILFVVMYHATTYTYYAVSNSSALNYVRYYLRAILSTCVPLFFFANGYLLFNRRFELKKHIIKTIKIIVLTIVWGIINLLLLMPIENEYLSLKEFLTYLETWHKGWINFLWYMGALVCIYVLFPILKIAFDNNKKIFIYFTIICAILTFGNAAISRNVSIVLNAMGQQEGMLSKNWFNMFNPFRGIHGYSFVYFCVGGLAHGLVKTIKEIPSKKRNFIAIIAIIFSCVGLFIMGVMLSHISEKTWDIVYNGYDTIFTFVNVCMIFVLSLCYNKSCRMIRLISINTLGIYFMHEIFIHLTRRVVKTTIPLAQSFTGCFIYSLVIIAVCLCLTCLFARIPVVKRLVKMQ